MGWAVGSTFYGANIPRRKDTLLSVCRAGIGFRDVWADDPLHFLFTTAYKTGTGLRLDRVPPLVCLPLRRVGSLWN
jgi:hypothetical protein